MHQRYALNDLVIYHLVSGPRFLLCDIGYDCTIKSWINLITNLEMTIV